MIKTNVIAAIAAMGILVLQSSAAEARMKKLWLCQSLCVAVNSDAQQIQVLDLIASTARTRLEAFTEMKLDCRDAAERLGMREAISARRVSYDSTRTDTRTRTEVVDVAHWSSEASGWGGSWRYGWSFEARGRARWNRRTTSETFTDSSGLKLEVEQAALSDPTVCTLETVGEDWVPYYPAGPGSRPQG